MSQDIKEIAEFGLGAFDMLADDIEPDKLAEEIGIVLIDAGLTKDEGTSIGEIAIEAFNNAATPDKPSEFADDEIYVEMLRQLNENRKPEDIPESSLKGKRVKHPKFGIGVIVEAYEKKDGIDGVVCVEFATVGIKWLIIEFANISIFD